MIEKHIVLEDIDPIMFYGVGNCHLQMVKSLFPKLRIMARGNVLRVLGDEEEIAKIEEDVETMRKHLLTHNTISEEDILDIIKGRKTASESSKGVIVYSMSGRPIKSKSENQQKLIDAYYENDMIFAVGPAGTGKTYLSIALAVKALKEKTAKKIILCRPAVEAGEKLGFLPGDIKDKIDPYLQPLYDALEDMLPGVKLQDMMEKRIIQICPLAFMRGRTLSDAIVILDEAQNTTPAQLRMFLTRMGWNTKMMITGDLTQVDLPKQSKSGDIFAFENGASVVKNDLNTLVFKLNLLKPEYEKDKTFWYLQSFVIYECSSDSMTASAIAACHHSLLAKMMWGAYSCLAVVMSLMAVKGKKKYWQELLLPFLFFLLHVSYGIGSLVGFLKLPFWKYKKCER